MTLAHAGATLLFDAELVTYRLEEAGATLLALPGTGWSTRLRGLVTGNRTGRGRELWLVRETYPSADPVSRAHHPDG